MMQFRHVGVAALAFGLLVSITNAEPNTLTKEEKEEGFVLLFDGKTMDGWTGYSDGGNEVTGDHLSFSVKDETLSCSGKGADYWIRHDDKFGDFVFRLQYKLAPRCNSGIFLRVPGNGRPAWTAFEIQLLDDYASEKPSKHTTGSIYDVIPPNKIASKPPGQWNDVEVTCKDKHVTVIVNGETLIDADFAKLTKPIGKFSIPYAELPVNGYLGVQNHGGKIDFRNIRIKTLD
jgi:hypothetical protein